MIHCTINGEVGYPSTSDKIKLTYNNPYVQDSGEYSYDISFPMSIHQNATLFKHVNRFDVKKRMSSFDDCKIYADNRLVISGKGTVTSISDTTVKLQIVGGKSRIKYNSAFEKHFIDDIDYFEGDDTLRGLDSRFEKTVHLKDRPDMVYINLKDSPTVSCYSGVFNPVWDEANSRFVNDIYYHRSVLTDEHGAYLNSGNPTTYVEMVRLAIQPRLQYVLEKVLEHEGYSDHTFNFDRSHFSRLFVVNAHPTFKIKEALPHWSVYTFLEELSKLLNVRFLFNETDKSVNVVPVEELYSSAAVAYECLDEYTCEFDDDGANLLDASNIEYKFDDTTSRSWRDSIPLNVQHIYATKYYKNRDEMGAALKLMPLKEQRQTIFAAQADGYFVYAKWPNKWNSDKLTESLVPCGVFSPIVRDADSTDSIEIKIAPASISRRKRSHKTDVVDGNHYVVCPSATDDYTGPSGSYEDEGGEPYSSVQEAIEGDATEDTQEENSVESDKTMSVFFTSSEKFFMMEGKGGWYEDIKVPGGLMPVDMNLYCHFPVSFVDHRAYPDWTGMKETASMDLHQLHHLQYSSPDDLRKDASHPDIDTHNLRCIKFLTDDIPDPSKIYIFHNRRFVCQKIEVEIVDGCVSQIKTGYFYEIL